MEISAETVDRFLRECLDIQLSEADLAQLLPYVQRYFAAATRLQALDLDADDPDAAQYENGGLIR